MKTLQFTVSQIKCNTKVYNHKSAILASACLNNKLTKWDRHYMKCFSLCAIVWQLI